MENRIFDTAPGAILTGSTLTPDLSVAPVHYREEGAYNVIPGGARTPRSERRPPSLLMKNRAPPPPRRGAEWRRVGSHAAFVVFWCAATLLSTAVAAALVCALVFA